mmetsp:Transcript_95869/g.205660  ORF Transcript_95869/g.205660 Transcript_95869/m.205660 type:complete len:221 (+) Transcript_95869:240-902(+)
MLPLWTTKGAFRRSVGILADGYPPSGLPWGGWRSMTRLASTLEGPCCRSLGISDDESPPSGFPSGGWRSTMLSPSTIKGSKFLAPRCRNASLTIRTIFSGQGATSTSPQSAASLAAFLDAVCSINAIESSEAGGAKLFTTLMPVCSMHTCGTHSDGAGLSLSRSHKTPAVVSVRAQMTWKPRMATAKQWFFACPAIMCASTSLLCASSSRLQVLYRDCQF